MSRPDDKWDAHAQMAPTSPWDFVLCCKTQDEHDPLAGRKLFPELAMYRILVRFWQEQPIFFLEKVRQHMFTWLMCILYLWDAMHRPGRRNIIGSINQIKANKVTDRIRKVYTQLEKDGYPHLAPVKKIGSQVGISNKIEFLEPIDSVIESVPQGPDVVISETLSHFFDDELHYNVDAGERYGKALPAIVGGGAYCGGGSPNGKWTFGYRMKYAIDQWSGKPRGEHKLDTRDMESIFKVPEYHSDGREMTVAEQRYWIEHQLVTMPDKEFYAIPLMQLVASCPGLWAWVTCDDTTVFGMHYEANPYHSQSTEEGREWKAERRPLFPDQDTWDQQMEISYSINPGRAVIADFKENKKAYIHSTEYDPRLTLDFSWDPGSDAACCLISQKHKISGFNAYQTHFLGEVFLVDTHTVELATEVLSYLEKHFPEALQHRTNFRSVCDPAGHQRKETASDKSLRTSISVIKAAGFKYVSALKVGVPQSVERCQTVMGKLYPGKTPGTAIIFDPRCKLLIEALEGGWRFPLVKSDRAAMKMMKGYPEKDGHFEHLGDSFRYRCVADFPDGKDVLDAQRDSEVRKRAIYDKYTGRLKRVVTVNAKNRRGRHAYHSQRVS